MFCTQSYCISTAAFFLPVYPTYEFPRLFSMFFPEAWCDLFLTATQRSSHSAGKYNDVKEA